MSPKHPNHSSSVQRADYIRKTSRRLTISTIANTIVFAICTAPNAIYYLIGIYSDIGYRVLSPQHVAVSFLQMCYGCLMPIVFLLSLHKLQMAAKEVLIGLWKRICDEKPDESLAKTTISTLESSADGAQNGDVLEASCLPCKKKRITTD
ncbi:hypothetical protein CRM22_005123 [Opisthorchis felineus]|uniref:G-protein coupled receptors family 1 profile domain-containing protein n=1 Tax=Opisthorchis felineus TaxID=147828 RepID=A0A4S2LZR4_OPIFE|nr:hypothetical protein CRM22_005123 [Opisthorchis felineus]